VEFLEDRKAASLWGYVGDECVTVYFDLPSREWSDDDLEVFREAFPRRVS
jgi:hypothetical protein